jgi:DNA-binding transcriptional LysR family regulator
MLSITAVNLSAIDLNLFLVLHAVLEERSATRAAKRLNVTQSAVSNALARLRGALGDPLVVRHGRGLVATPRALELAPAIAAAIAGLAGAVDRGRGFVPAACTRTFTIAAADNHQISETAGIAAAFARTLPRAALRVVSADVLAASNGLASGEIDAAFVPAMLPVDAVYRSTPAFTEHGCIVVRRDHPGVGRTITKRQFNQLGHIDVEVALGKLGVVHRAAAQHWQRAGLERRVAITVPSFTVAAMMASRTDLVAGLPSRAAATLCKLFHLKALRSAFALPALEMALLWHERTDADPGAAYMRALVLDVARRKVSS